MAQAYVLKSEVTLLHFWDEFVARMIHLVLCSFERKICMVLCHMHAITRQHNSTVLLWRCLLNDISISWISSQIS